MKVLVCGAAGWTGRAVLQNLAGKHEVRAFDLNPAVWQAWEDLDGPTPTDIDVVYGDIVDFDTTLQLVEGVDAVIHLSVFFPQMHDEDTMDRDNRPFLVNLKGLWNLLEASRRHRIRRVVHMGSCHATHPDGVFYSSDVRRPDGHLYAVCKRLQEEMCRQYYEAHGLSIVVLRPDYIVDSRLGIGRFREELEKNNEQSAAGWVCRHDLAEACRLAAENEDLEFEVLHVVGTRGAEETCNVARTREVLGWEFREDVDRFR
jgi:nucleoside-diphosphate-sugar epimerase